MHCPSVPNPQRNPVPGGTGGWLVLHGGTILPPTMLDHHPPKRKKKKMEKKEFGLKENRCGLKKKCLSANRGVSTFVCLPQARHYIGIFLS